MHRTCCSSSKSLSAEFHTDGHWQCTQVVRPKLHKRKMQTEHVRGCKLTKPYEIWVRLSMKPECASCCVMDGPTVPHLPNLPRLASLLHVGHHSPHLLNITPPLSTAKPLPWYIGWQLSQQHLVHPGPTCLSRGHNAVPAQASVVRLNSSHGISNPRRNEIRQPFLGRFLCLFPPDFWVWLSLASRIWIYILKNLNASILSILSWDLGWIYLAFPILLKINYVGYLNPFEKPNSTAAPPK